MKKLAIVLLAALALIPVAHSARTHATVSVSPGPYTFAQTVQVTTDAPTGLYPWLALSCTQNGQVVGTATHAAFPGGYYYGQPFSLGPSLAWTGGGADCTFTAEHLTNGRLVVDGRTTIRVEGD